MFMLYNVFIFHKRNKKHIMIRIRSFITSDEEIIMSWCRDEKTFDLWTAGTLGEYPLTREKFAKTADIMRFTALDDNEVSGFFTMRNPKGTPDEIRFGYVIVNPEKRGKGIGRKMLQLGLEFAFDIYQTDKVTLGVFEENEKACRCYRAAGFKETDYRETYAMHGIQLTAIDMEVNNPQREKEKCDVLP